MSRKNNGVTNTVVSYDGIAKRLLDNMDDEKMIDFINHVVYQNV